MHLWTYSDGCYVVFLGFFTCGYGMFDHNGILGMFMAFMWL